MFGTKDAGEQWIVQLLANSTVHIGLYDDEVDDPSDAADLPLSTEPDDGNYQRLEYSPGTVPLEMQQNANGDWQLVFSEQTFDLINTTGGSVNGSFGVVNYQAQSESEANDHLWFTDGLTDDQDDSVRVELEGSKAFDFSGTYTVIDPGQSVP